jgi:hypothetical protein
MIGFPRLDEEMVERILRTTCVNEAFFFYTVVDRSLGISANSLRDFYEKIYSIDISSITFHMARHDFECWIDHIGDVELKERVSFINGLGLTGEDLQEHLYQTLKVRYDKLRSLVS